MDTRVEDKALVCLQKIQLNYPKLTERQGFHFHAPHVLIVHFQVCRKANLPAADVSGCVPNDMPGSVAVPSRCATAVLS